MYAKKWSIFKLGLLCFLFVCLLNSCKVTFQLLYLKICLNNQEKWVFKYLCIKIMELFKILIQVILVNVFPEQRYNWNEWHWILDSINLCNVIFSNNKVYVIPNPKLKNRCERERGGGRDREITAERQTELIASAEQS